MIYVDPRAGSRELVTPLRRMGLVVDDTDQLAFGDLEWVGRGNRGRAVSVGVEFKTLREFVQALRTQRLTGYQMRGMRERCDYNYLLIEGELLYDARGCLLRRSGSRHRPVPLEGQMTVGELLKRVQVLHLCGGLNPLLTVTRADTLQTLHALYHVWTDTDLDQHRSHLGLYTAPPLLPVSAFRASVATFPGVGYRTSAAVEKAFHGSLQAATGASAEEWATIPVTGEDGKPRRFGIRRAEAVVAYCRGKGGAA